MDSITNITRRTLWPLVFKGAMAAGVTLAFCTRYLVAPLELDEPATGEVADDSDMSTRKALSQVVQLQAAQQKQARQPAQSGRLTARPITVKGTARHGLFRLGLSKLRDGLIYIPAGYKANRPAPLALALHGAGGNAQQGMRLLRSHADRAGFIVLAVESRRSTWDVLLGGYGPDVEFINRALTRTFRRYAVDPAHVAVAGFSDGASYALSLGITNGDLFRFVIAFSPGFMAPEARRG